MKIEYGCVCGRHIAVEYDLNTYNQKYRADVLIGEWRHKHRSHNKLTLGGGEE